MIGHALPELGARVWGPRSWFKEYGSGVTSPPASDAGPGGLAVRQQPRWSAEYRHRVLDDSFEEERRQARAVRPPGDLSTLHGLVKAERFSNIACSRCHYTSPPTSS